MLALAYDDGPYQYTQKLVDTLTAGGARGTFFVTGTLYGTDSSRTEVLEDLVISSSYITLTLLGCIYNQRTALQNAYKGKSYFTRTRPIATDPPSF